MNLGLTPLLQRIAMSHDERFVLATVIETDGPSYRKPGAMVLIPLAGPAVGLVSGGCLEGDLQERAAGVSDRDSAIVVTYDLRTDEDMLWGLGLGCGGLIRVLLEPASSVNGFAGLSQLAEYWRAGQPCRLIKDVTEDATAGVNPVTWVTAGHAPLPFSAVASLSDEHVTRVRHDGRSYLVVPVTPPTSLLLCGAGPDAAPLAQLASLCGWRVWVYDHRPAYADPAHFPDAEQVVCGRPEALAETELLDKADAAVIMSHHLASDIEYMRVLAAGGPRYVGVLGPGGRRDELLTRAGVRASGRVYGPAGLDIGADLPETIALSILAEAHAVLNDGHGGSLRTRD